MKEIESRWKGKTILVVEDNESCFLLLAEYLEIINANCLRAKNINEVTEIISTFKVDLALIDIILPNNESGYDITKKIKLLFPNLPVIIQSAKVYDLFKEKSFEVGCDSFIAKPYTFSIFFKTIEQIPNIESSIEYYLN